MERRIKVGPKKDRVWLLGLSFFYFAIYMILFHIGNFSAADRSNYYEIFQIPYGESFGRIEPAFMFLAKNLYHLGFSPAFGVNLVGVIIALSSLAVVMFALKKREANFWWAYPTLVFAFVGILSFAQLRAAVAVWLSLGCYYLFLNSRNKVWLFFLSLLISFHYSILFFALAIINHLFIRFRMIFVLSLLLIVTFAFVLYAPVFTDLLGLDPYYLAYFGDGKARNFIFFSPLLWSYFISCLLLYGYLKKDEREKYDIVFYGIPLCVVAFFTGVDLFVKFTFPLMILSWFALINLVVDRKLEMIGQNYKIFAGVSLVFLSISYAFWRYN